MAIGFSMKTSLPASSTSRGDLALHHEGGRNCDRIDLWVGQHRLVVRVELGDPQAALHRLAEVLPDFGKRYDFAIGNGSEVGEMDFLCHESATHVPQTYLCHHCPRSSVTVE